MREVAGKGVRMQESGARQYSLRGYATHAGQRVCGGSRLNLDT